ncbi:MAG: hypothetical protein P9L89_05415 [Candidatus Celaenobacter polaris]|nr:hypothetical protein [Candidatus Celaenobacter polaris]
MPNETENVGISGEKLVENFFDSRFSKIFSFANPKTKDNAEITDVLIWMNRVALLIEVKTRDQSEGTTSINNWARNRMERAVEQLEKGYNRIKSKETIFLNNSLYQTQLDCEGISQIIGLIVLVYDEECNIYPSDYLSEIYKKELPIHVISWSDLEKLIHDIDTVPDFIYYLNDRYNFLKHNDLPLNRELNVLGIYKNNENKFPTKTFDFLNYDYWSEYQRTKVDEIKLRNEHNKHSVWIDKIEAIFTDKRKLFDGYPLGLYFAWELGSISRRERAMLGEKLDSVQEWFESGKSSRQFAYQNSATHNWIIFYFSKTDQDKQAIDLERLVRLKLIQSIHGENFKFGVYGLGFLVSKTYPIRFLGFGSAIVMSLDGVDTYTDEELEIARRMWGQKKEFKIEEFPTTKV